MNFKMIFALLMGLDLGSVFMNIPPAMGELMRVYGSISYAKTSILLSALIWTHALIQIPAGMLTDRLGLKRNLLASILFIVVGNFISVAAPSFELALLGRVIAGIGTGLSFPVILKLVALYAPGGRIGTYQAFFGGCFSLGSVISYIAIPRLILFGWQRIYIMPGLFSLLLLAMAPLLRLQPEPEGKYLPINLGRLLRLRDGWILGLCHGISYGSVLNLGNWVPSILAEISKQDLSIRFLWGGAFVMLISGMGRLFGGFLLIRFTSIDILSVSIAAISFLNICLFLFSSPAVALVLALLVSWFASINFGAIFYLAGRATATDSQTSLATLVGFVNFLANLGAIFFILLFGFIKDLSGTFFWGFGVLSVMSFVLTQTGLCGLRRAARARASRM